MVSLRNKKNYGELSSNTLSYLGLCILHLAKSGAKTNWDISNNYCN